MPSENKDIAISVRNLTKTYRLFGHPGDRVKQFLSLGLKRYHREFTALQDITFDLKKGETIGIIGRNGSGKSTLLQLICGILKPTSGTVTVNGRVSALLELGAGFNPEFTGRENVYFQGAITGLSREEMNACFDDITSFADIGEFIEQPVRTYSSGMFVRLAFAVAIHVAPDILVIDEALSVGDIGFQAKCMRKITELQESGVTILLVTHNTDQVVNHCNRGLLLDHGVLILDDIAKTSIYEYKRLITSGKSESPPRAPAHEQKDTRSHRLSTQEADGTGVARFIEISLVDLSGAPSDTVHRNAEFAINARVQLHGTLKSPLIFFLLSDAKGTSLCGTSSLAQGIDFGEVKKGTELEIAFRQPMLLNPGEYFLSVGCQTLDGNGYLSHDLRWECLTFHVLADSPRPGIFDPQSSIHWKIKLPHIAPGN